MRCLAAMIALCLLAGCASSSFVPSAATRLAPWEGKVAVLSSLPAEGSYQLLGVVTVRGVELTSDERMFDTLKAHAAAQGADAVVLQGAIRDRLDGEERRLGAYAIRRR